MTYLKVISGSHRKYRSQNRSLESTDTYYTCVSRSRLYGRNALRASYVYLPSVSLYIPFTRALKWIWRNRTTLLTTHNLPRLGSFSFSLIILPTLLRRTMEPYFHNNWCLKKSRASEWADTKDAIYLEQMSGFAREKDHNRRCLLEDSRETEILGSPSMRCHSHMYFHWVWRILGLTAEYPVTYLTTHCNFV